jgi:hypothetical protein
MRLDTSLLSVLAAVTGDQEFLRWRPAVPPVRVDSSADVPLMVYEHAVLCEYAHARLGQLRDAGSMLRSSGLRTLPAPPMPRTPPAPPMQAAR